ncbi:MAG: hypothetical protein AAF902_05745 [Chloroflexota bacterium]
MTKKKKGLKLNLKQEMRDRGMKPAGTISTTKDGRLIQTTYNIPDNIRDAVREEGRSTKANVSGFAGILLSHALKQYRNGEIDIRPYLIDTSSSPRYLYTWDFEKIDKILMDS